MYRQDRTAHGGGILCFVKSCIPHRERRDMSYNDNGIESIVVEITFDKDRWYIVTIYRPPNVPVYHLIEALTVLAETCQSNGKCTFIMGDINIDFLKPINPLSDVLDVYGLKNIVTGPTCFKSKTNPSSVDVILTDSKLKVKSCINVGNGISDFHNTVCVSTKRQAPTSEARVIIYRSYKKFNEHDFINELEYTPLYIASIFDDPNDMLWFHNTLLDQVVNTHAPLKKKTIYGKILPCMNGLLRKAINVKGMLWRKYTKNGRNNEDWVRYAQQRNHVTDLKRKSTCKYFDDNCNEDSRNKKFWDTVKPFMSEKSGKSSQNITLLEYDDVITDKPRLCNIFNDFFIEVARSLNEPHPPQ